MINLFPETMFTILGWTLVHSLWQGFLIAVLLKIVLSVVNKRDSRLRYFISYATLIVFILVSFRTFSDISSENLNIVETTVHNNLTINHTQKSLNDNTNSIITSKDFNNISLEYLTFAKSYISSNIKIIVFLWFVGVIFLSIRFIGGVIYTQRL